MWSLYRWVHWDQSYFDFLPLLGRHFYRHTLFSMERDVSSATMPSVCFSFLIGLYSCTLVVLVDELWTSTSYYVTIFLLYDSVVKTSSTHSSIIEFANRKPILLSLLICCILCLLPKRIDNFLLLLYRRRLNMYEIKFMFKKKKSFSKTLDFYIDGGWSFDWVWYEIDYKIINLLLIKLV